MNYKEAIDSLKLKFTSANSVPVERSVITRDEWEAILSGIGQYKQVSVAMPSVRPDLSVATLSFNDAPPGTKLYINRQQDKAQ